MSTYAQVKLAQFREDAVVDQMYLIEELVKMSANPRLAQRLADRLIDRAIHYTEFNRAIQDLYDQPTPKKTFWQKLLRK